MNYRLMPKASLQDCIDDAATAVAWAFLYELDGFDHGAMVSPAFHILKNHIKK